MPPVARASTIRRLAASLPADAIVLENDAPDIAPAWVHPVRNAPAASACIAAALASLRLQPLADVVRQTAAAAARALPALAARLTRG